MDLYSVKRKTTGPCMVSAKAHRLLFVLQPIPGMTRIGWLFLRKITFSLDNYPDFLINQYKHWSCRSYLHISICCFLFNACHYPVSAMLLQKRIVFVEFSYSDARFHICSEKRTSDPGLPSSGSSVYSSDLRDSNAMWLGQSNITKQCNLNEKYWKLHSFLLTYEKKTHFKFGEQIKVILTNMTYSCIQIFFFIIYWFSIDRPYW